MRFSIQAYCEGSECETIIVATGTIDSQSVAALQSLLQTHLIAPKFIEIHSTQGDILSGMQLGQFIRQNKLNTRVRYQLGHNRTITTQTQSPAQCLGACMLAFMGGILRHIDNRATIGIHHSGLRGRDILERYTHSMGVDASIWKALDNPKLSIIDLMTAQYYGLDNRRHNALRPWQLRPTKNGVFITSTNELPGDEGRATLALSRVDSGWRLIVHLNTHDYKYHSRLMKQANLSYHINHGEIRLIRSWFEVKDGLQAWFSLEKNQLINWSKEREMSLSVFEDKTVLINITSSNEQLIELVKSLP